ncbi:MAG: class I SAM-dependent methyltransferase [Promethearchaeota archaeon]
MSEDTSKVPYEFNSVQATNFMPLWGRAKYSVNNPELLHDPVAVDLMNRIQKDLELDYSLIEKTHKKRIEYFGMIFLARARNMDNALKYYLSTYPKCTVVNLGVGLETSFFRCDNQQLQWYDVDFPDVINFRKKYLPESDRYHYLAQSVLDFSWMDKIQFIREKGIFIIAGGLFMYFTKEEISNLLSTMAEKFPSGELIFDHTAKNGVKIANKRTLKAGRTEMLFKSYCKNPKKDYEPIHPSIKVKDQYLYWKRTKINPQWVKTTKMMIKLSTLLKMAYFIHVEFKLN